MHTALHSELKCRPGPLLTLTGLFDDDADGHSDVDNDGDGGNDGIEGNNGNDGSYGNDGNDGDGGKKKVKRLMALPPR